MKPSEVHQEFSKLTQDCGYASAWYRYALGCGFRRAERAMLVAIKENERANRLQNEINRLNSVWGEGDRT